MSRIMHNLVVFIEPSPKKYEIALEAGNKILNRFCIDEDAAFELSEINDLKKTYFTPRLYNINDRDKPYRKVRKEKGNVFS